MYHTIEGLSMTKNLGTTDRIVRSVAGIVILFLILTGALEGTTAVILGIIAVALLLTSAISFCPAYLPLKLSTLKAQKPKN
jgi:hypothetical protein